MDVEAALITKIIEDKLVDEFNSDELKRSFFIDYENVWDYILEVYKKHGSLPSCSILESKLNFEPVFSTDSFSFLLGEVKNKYLTASIMESIAKQGEALKSRDPVKAIELMRASLSNLERATIESNDLNIVEDPMSRLDDYLKIKDKGGMTGIPGPWEPFNRQTAGIQDEDLFMFVSRSGIGKTWCEVILANYFRNLAIPSVMFSYEMSAKQIARRGDAVGAKVPFSKLKNGTLSKEELERYKEYLGGIKGSVPLIISGDISIKSTVSSVAAKIDLYNPKIVLIDGVYMMRDERNSKSHWEKFSNICEDLKMLAQNRKVPIGVTHQFNLEGKEEGTADTLKYGDVKMWFDFIVGMYQTEDLRASKEMLFKFLKLREGDPTSWVSSWDLYNMTFDTKVSGIDDIGSSPIEIEADAYEEGDIPF